MKKNQGNIQKVQMIHHLQKKRKNPKNTNEKKVILDLRPKAKKKNIKDLVLDPDLEAQAIKKEKKIKNIIKTKKIEIGLIHITHPNLQEKNLL